MFWRRKKKDYLIFKINKHQTRPAVVFSIARSDQPDELLQLPLEDDVLNLLHHYEGITKYWAWLTLWEEGVINQELELSFDDWYTLLKPVEYFDLHQNQQEQWMDEQLTLTRKISSLTTEPENVRLEWLRTIRECLHQLNLPIMPASIKGELKWNGGPLHGELELVLKDDHGRVLNRVGNDFGCYYAIDNKIVLLPENVYRLRQTIHEEFDTIHEKIAVAQKYAKKTGIVLDSFLTNNQFHVVEEAKLDLRELNSMEWELTLKGTTDEESKLLEGAIVSNHGVMTTGQGLKRERMVLSPNIRKQAKMVAKHRKLTGEQIPEFISNPSAFFEQGTQDLDMSLFSGRVNGLVEMKSVTPRWTNSGIKWFDERGEMTELDTDKLRDIVLKNPTQQFFRYQEKWVHLNHHWKKKLLGEPESFEKQVRKWYRLSIYDNVELIEYQEENTKSERIIAHVSLPQGLNADLLPHQILGYEWLCNLYANETSGLLADDMGLGKTLQVLTFLLHLKHSHLIKPTLIVLPLTLIQNWKDEIIKFTPELSGSLYVHSGSSRLRIAEQIETFDIIITTYDTLRLDQMVLGKVSFQTIICDEAQNVKNHNGQRSHALRAMKSAFRLAMTGTPVETSLNELWSIMDFVMPGSFGSMREFNKKFIATENYEALKSQLEPFFLRRTKKGVLADKLPRKHELIVRKVPASNTQVMLAEAIWSGMTSASSKKMSGAILEALIKLRQMYGHPNLVLPPDQHEEIMSTKKMKSFYEIVEKVRINGEKLLVFTEFLPLQDLIRKWASESYHLHVPVINGTTTHRQSVVKMFNEKDGFGLMILSPKAAGVGLNIVGANHVVHFTRWWNPAVENQATDRVYRIGQSREVYVYTIITQDPYNFPNGTVEEHIHTLLENRQALADDVIRPYIEEEIWKLIHESMI
jgi:hypothetical protein